MKTIIRKQTICFIACVLLIAASSTAFALCGDVSGDGQILSNDLLMVARASIGTLTLTAEQNARADCVVSGTENNPDSSIMSNDLLMVARASIGTTVLKCNEGGSTFSGTASAPSGVSLGRSAGRTANAMGLEAKSSVTVEAYYIDDDGAKSGNTIQKAFTNSSGNYSFTLPASVTVASNLIIVAGAGDNQMRAIVTSMTVNINPVTELVTAEIVANAQPLANFTASEIETIKTQAETDAAALDLSAAVSVSAAVTTLNTGTLAANLDTSVLTTSGTGASAVCGNNTVETGEQCDDGNTTSGDGCSSTCSSETPSNTQRIAAGYYHTCSLTASSGVKCWGANEQGQLGDGTTTDRLTPVDVSGLTSGVAAIATYGNHTCALTTSGGVKCWGDNEQGQLGDGATTDRLTPVDVSGLTSGVAAMAAGYTHTCALTMSGGVKCWGDNSQGQLGDGTTTDRLTPMDVNGLTSGVAAIDAGYSHTCVLTTSGGAKCWGDNSYGGLGDGTTTQRLTPVDVSGLSSGVAAISAGGKYTCALTTSNGVKCWGINGYGQLGDGTTTQSLTPVDVSGLSSGVSAIATSGWHNSCALTTSGGVKCWGYNISGQLGDGTTTDRLTPVDVSGLTSGITAISVSGVHTCALTTSGGVKCWGDNSRGQLGDGTTANRSTPVAVGQTTPAIVCGNSTVESGEACDDGNTTGGDGCSATCQTEAGNSWAKTFGGTGYEYTKSVQQTADGGYVVAGYTSSYGAGSNDFWVLKLDSSGNQVWAKTFGGMDMDGATSVEQTSDGGYIVAGYTFSYGAGGNDSWVLKLDSSGNQVWAKTFGGTGTDYAYFVQQTTDGEYIVAGYTDSYGAGSFDFWVLKLDGLGNQVWAKTFGGTSADIANSVRQTIDGGYIVEGRTDSYGAGSTDFWVLKLDSLGNQMWAKTFGGTGADSATSIDQTSDGGYIVAGGTDSYGAGNYDLWALKLDSSGNQVWAKTFGGTGADVANSVLQTTDGGYIVTGFTTSYGAGGYDVWALKLNSSGNQVWTKTFGGTGTDGAHGPVRQTTDGGYVVAGVTSSYGAGSDDFWVLKLDSSGACTGSGCP